MSPQLAMVILIWPAICRHLARWLGRGETLDRLSTWLWAIRSRNRTGTNVSVALAYEREHGAGRRTSRTHSQIDQLAGHWPQDGITAFRDSLETAILMELRLLCSLRTVNRPPDKSCPLDGAASSASRLPMTGSPDQVDRRVARNV